MKELIEDLIAAKQRLRSENMPGSEAMIQTANELILELQYIEVSERLGDKLYPATGETKNAKDSSSEE